MGRVYKRSQLLGFARDETGATMPHRAVAPRQDSRFPARFACTFYNTRSRSNVLLRDRLMVGLQVLDLAI